MGNRDKRSIVTCDTYKLTLQRKRINMKFFFTYTHLSSIWKRLSGSAIITPPAAIPPKINKTFARNNKIHNNKLLIRIIKLM